LTNQPTLIPWVEQFRDAIGFGVQTFALDSDPQPSKTVIAAGQLVDKLGFDAFFIGDHPGYATEAWLHLAAVAVTTSRVRLGSIVNCASYRHPAYLARLAADLDNISGGRLLLGLGIGWNDQEFGQLGIPFNSIRERQEALVETIDIVRGLWGEEPFTYHGKHWSTTAGRVVPPPVQQPGPPLIIAGSGELGTLRQVAKYADACNFGAGRNVGAVRGDDQVRQKLQILRQRCDEIGRNYDDILKSYFVTWLILGETDEDAQAKLNGYYPEGLTDEQRVTRIAGSPERVISYFQSLVDDGIQYFVVQIMDAGDAETMKLLAREVAPKVKSRTQMVNE
jgi:alkanesulfonate monooxygenase SsuD/methylene tetrahydromethanopterin reductase-like flavin-dependent oxidoreductase (luciferase family)